MRFPSGTHSPFVSSFDVRVQQSVYRFLCGKWNEAEDGRIHASVMFPSLSFFSSSWRLVVYRTHAGFCRDSGGGVVGVDLRFVRDEATFRSATETQGKCVWGRERGRDQGLAVERHSQLFAFPFRFFFFVSLSLFFFVFFRVRVCAYFCVHLWRWVYLYFPLSCNSNLLRWGLD